VCGWGKGDEGVEEATLKVSLACPAPRLFFTPHPGLLVHTQVCSVK
jgi:hypothetical protein